MQVARIGLVALAAASLVGCGADNSPSPAAHPTSVVAASTCDLGTLDGSYLYEIHGSAQFKQGFAPFYEVGVMAFDGKGGVARIGTDSISRSEATTKMTYQVGADCVGQLTSSSGGTYRATVSPAGDEVTFFAAGDVKAQAALDGGATKVGAEESIDCHAGSLVGTYQYRSRSVVGTSTHIEHGFEVYDGKGAVTNAYRVAGVDKPQRLAGAFVLKDACHAVVTYQDGPTIDEYISPDGAEFYWIQTDAAKEPGFFGGHEHRVSSSTATTITTPVS
ncbi:MAG: hypothetical protein JWQ74_3189 [Marmoricola sp.]|nr:hypothetical protein [Marmoricola sp.]